MKHIIYSNQDWDAAQNALNAGTLENPYIAAIRWYGGIDIDYNTKEQQSCQDRDLCGDDPTDCHECTCQEQYSDPAEICECEGGYYWGDECHDEPEPEPSDPCEEYEEGTQEKCECEGKYWYNDTCNDEPESEPSCEDQGLCDDGEGGCVDCPPPCEEYEERSVERMECECQILGGTWDAENERCNYDWD